MNSSSKEPPINKHAGASLDPPLRAADAALPGAPVVVIEPRRDQLNLPDLWHYRDLFYVLTARDVKVRYKQTFLGILWAILQPLLTMIIFTFLFGRLVGVPSDNLPYALFAYAALVPWTFFSNAVTASGNSLVGNSSLITKVYFPRMIIPMAAVCAGLVDFAVAFALLALLMLFYGVGFSINVFMLPVLTLLTAMLAAGVGMWMSAVNVKYRDVRYALPFVIQIWMFATPIIYPLSLVPEKWRWLLLINPLTGLIEGFRAAIFGKPFDFAALGVSTAIILSILFYSLREFRRMERGFADLV